MNGKYIDMVSFTLYSFAAMKQASFIYLVSAHAVNMTLSGDMLKFTI